MNDFVRFSSQIQGLDAFRIDCDDQLLDHTDKLFVVFLFLFHYVRLAAGAALVVDPEAKENLQLSVHHLRITFLTKARKQSTQTQEKPLLCCSLILVVVV